MNSPLSEVLALTLSMLAAAKAGNWLDFGSLRARRTRLLQPGLYTHAQAPRLLPRLDAAQKELASMLRDDGAALDESSELLRPIRDAGTEDVSVAQGLLHAPAVAP